MTREHLFLNVVYTRNSEFGICKFHATVSLFKKFISLTVWLSSYKEDGVSTSKLLERDYRD